MNMVCTFSYSSTCQTYIFGTLAYPKAIEDTLILIWIYILSSAFVLLSIFYQLQPNVSLFLSTLYLWWIYFCLYILLKSVTETQI